MRCVNIYKYVHPLTGQSVEKHSERGTHAEHTETDHTRQPTAANLPDKVLEQNIKPKIKRCQTQQVSGKKKKKKNVREIIFELEEDARENEAKQAIHFR